NQRLEIFRGILDVYNYGLSDGEIVIKMTVQEPGVHQITVAIVPIAFYKKTSFAVTNRISIAIPIARNLRNPAGHRFDWSYPEAFFDRIDWREKHIRGGKEVTLGLVREVENNSQLITDTQLFRTFKKR